jgi:predicted metal-dependent peptidase
MTQDLARRISKAKTTLLLDQKSAFIGSLALGLPTVITDSIKTACTDGKSIMFNPKFCADLTDEEMVFLIAHETMHPMLEHNYRLQGRNHSKWNKAADYVINQLLVEEKIGKFIEGGCLSDSLYKAGNGITDSIYSIMPDDDGNDGDGNGGIGDDIIASNATGAEQEAEIGEWKLKVANAAQAAKLMGSLSANMERLVGAVLEPKIDWRDVLRDFVFKAKTDERSFARPNRRFISQGVYLPSITGETLGDIVMAIDCSGSIGQKEIDMFAAEMRAIKSDGNPTAMHVVYFDHDVCHYDKFGPDEELIVKPRGGGGTAFSPVFKYIEDHDIQPIACVFLTDLYCDDYGPAPEYPVLWAVFNGPNDPVAPFGRVVKATS